MLSNVSKSILLLSAEREASNKALFYLALNYTCSLESALGRSDSVFKTVIIRFLKQKREKNNYLKCVVAYHSVFEHVCENINAFTFKVLEFRCI